MLQATPGPVCLARVWPVTDSRKNQYIHIIKNYDHKLLKIKRKSREKGKICTRNTAKHKDAIGKIHNIMLYPGIVY